METEAPCSMWRRTSGAAPDAVKVARPVLNGEDEETGRKALRLVLTQLHSLFGKSGLRIPREDGSWPLLVIVASEIAVAMHRRDNREGERSV